MCVGGGAHNRPNFFSFLLHERAVLNPNNIISQYVSSQANSVKYLIMNKALVYWLGDMKKNYEYLIELNITKFNQL